MQLIFDLNHLAYRTLFACKGDIEQVGFKFHQHIMYNTVFSLGRKLKADEIVLCVDHKLNWRKKIYPEYKATRKEDRDKSDVDWNAFFESFQEFVDQTAKNFPFYVLQVKYMEADDLAAMLAKTQQDVPKTIITSDGDYVQLMRYKNVKIFDPMKSKYKKCDDPIRDLKIKCLMGDRSDNIPAIKPRVGAKTAEKFVEKPELLKELFEQPGLGEEYKENYRRNIRLIDLNRVPDKLFDYSLNKYENYELPNAKNIFTFLVKHKFRDLVNKIDEIETLCNHLVEYHDLMKL
jgi:5'-3' exonuclease